jgi:hypothetical protein
MSANRTKTGKKAPPTAFKPGQSGNPSGRPKLPEDVKHVRELAREYTQEAVDALVTVLRGESSSAGAKVSAAQALLDRGWGKAEANVNMTVKRDAKEMTDDELAAIAAGGSPTLAQAPTGAGESGQLH